MKREIDERAVSRLDQLARDRPHAYRLRLAALATLGYAYFVFIAALLACFAGTIAYFAYERGIGAALSVAAPLFVLFLLGGRSVIGRMQGPDEGVVIKPADAPELLKWIAAVHKRMRAPRIHRIVITSELNASVVRFPQLFPYPRTTFYLNLGLPLLWTLRSELFTALVAHEIGHVSAGHDRFSNWIYKIRTTWLGLATIVMHDHHWSAFLFRRFLRWFAPYFARYSMALARAQEYEADRAAARAAGGAQLAAALLRIAIFDRVLDSDYWPRISRSVAMRAEPPENAISELRNPLMAALTDERCNSLLEQTLAALTDEADTHPALSERLQALGLAADTGALPASVRSLAFGNVTETAAASNLLGALEASIAARLDLEYADAARESWHERHREMVRLAARRDALESRALISPLTPGEKQDRIAWTAELEGPAAALPLARAFASDPASASSAEAKFTLGRLLLASDDASGLSFIDTAMRMDPAFVEPACNVAFDFLYRTGRSTEAEAYRRKLLDPTGTAMRSVSSPDTAAGRFRSHGLAAAETTGLHNAIEKQGDVQRAFLVRSSAAFRRDDVALGEQQLLLAIEVRRGRDGGRMIDSLISDLAPTESFVIVVLEGRYRRWRHAIEGIPGALLFDSGASGR